MKIPTVTKRPSANNWPTLRHFMDEALDAPRGIRLHHINNVPLTVSRASDIRNIMGKIRKSDQRRNQIGLDPTDPVYGQSPYNALTFIIIPILTDTEITIRWHWPGADFPWQNWISINPEHMPENARQLLSACDIVANLNGQKFTAQSAPTFAKGWQSIRSQLPAWLDILNTYNVLADDDFEILGRTEDDSVQPVQLQIKLGNPAQ
jgi:hypothetical protein